MENKHTLCREKSCMKKFVSLREQTKNTTSFEKKRTLPLTKEKLNSHQNAKVCYICGKGILKKLSKGINYWRVTDHYHYTVRDRFAAHSFCNLKFNVSYETPIVFHNSSNYDYHFIIK